MDRREFLQCAAILTSGASVAQLGFALHEEQLVYLATAPDFIASDVNYFTPAQRQTIAALAEAIIPATDTPGAIDAGVPKFIELMVANWLNDQERSLFDAGFASLESQTLRDHSLRFEQLGGQQQRRSRRSMRRGCAGSPTAPWPSKTVSRVRCSTSWRNGGT